MRRRVSRESEDEFKPFVESSGDHPRRPIALWLWNDRLDPQEVRRQVRLFAGAGFGAFTIKPGIGLLTSFLSDGWLDAVEAAIDEARRAGLRIILHDGGRAYPTPGRARWLDPQFQRKTLRYEILDDPVPDDAFAAREQSLALFSAVRRDDGLADFQRLSLAKYEPPPVASETEAPPGEREETTPASTAESAAVTTAESSAPTPESRVGGDAAVAPETGPAAVGRVRVHFYWESAGSLDPLDPAAVRAFLDSGYELCYREFGSEFAHSIAGMAAEMPDFEAVPWSAALAALSLELTGREVTDLLPAVLLGRVSQEALARARDRYDYWRIVSQAYVRAFSRPIQQWCANRDILLEAAFSGSASLASQMNGTAGLIPVLLGASVPAANGEGPAAPDLPAIKTAVSAARQSAASAGCRALSHPFLPDSAASRGGSVWWAAAVQAALGVGVLASGPFFYSIRGDRKRQAPDGLALPQPESKDLSHLNDSLERLISVMNAGQPVTELLIIHPLRSAWIEFTPAAPDVMGSPGALEDLESSLADLADGLACSGRDFDFADETVLAERASVEDGQLQIGDAVYRAIVIPDIVSLASTTVDLLECFMESGGVVAAVGRLPIYEDGVPSDRPAAVLRTAVHPGGGTAGLLEALEPANFRLKLTAGSGVYCQHRDAGRRQFVLLANASEAEPAPVQLRLTGQGRMDRWDCESGAVTPIFADTDGESVSISLTVPGGGMTLLVMDTARAAPVGINSDDAPEIVLGQAPRGLEEALERTSNGVSRVNPGEISDSAGGEVSEVIVLPERWELRTEGPNVLVLDRASAKIGAGSWSPIKPLEVIRAGARDDTASAHLRFQVDLAEGTPRKGLVLVVEQPKLWSVAVNGVSLPEKDDGGWRYPFQRKFNVGRLLKEGPNIVLMTRGSAEATLEEVYLLGDFVVEGETAQATPGGFTPSASGAASRGVSGTGSFRIGPMPRQTTGDLIRAGLGHHSGTTVLLQTVSLPRIPESRVFLDLDVRFEGSLSVRINGRHAGTLMWGPYRLEVTGLVRPGKNKIELQFVNRDSIRPPSLSALPMLRTTRLLFTAKDRNAAG